MPLHQDSLKTLSQIANILQKSDPRENPLAHIVSRVRRQTESDVCSLYLLQNQFLILVATDGLDPASVGKVRMKIDEGLTGLAVETLQPVIVNEAKTHPRYKFFPLTQEERFSSFAAVPLIDRVNVVGVLTIQTVKARKFPQEEIEILKLIAFQLAGVIHNLVTLEILRSAGPTEKSSIQLEGTAAAPGFGIGPAFFLRHGVSPVIVPPNPHQKTSPEKEWKKLQAALQKTIQDLVRFEKKLLREFSRKESDIFYSHRMILSDETFLGNLKEEIDKKNSAIQAVGKVIGNYIQRFESIENTYFRERASDLEDIRQRILEHLIGASRRKIAKNWEGVLIADTLMPSDMVHLDPHRISGIVTLKGGVTSHASILARSLGIPAVMGISGGLSQIQPGDLLIVDGNRGKIILNPEPDLLEKYEKIQENYVGHLVHLQKFASEPARTRDGKRIRLEANLGFFSDLKKLRYYGAEGIGLYRTEFPFLARKTLPDETEQLQLYESIVEEAEGLPVTFRILDAGGDKPIPSLNFLPEANPFLGHRAIRLTLSQPTILHVQFRALLRASTRGPIRILVPMVSGLEELLAVKKIFEEEKANLKADHLPFDENVPFGIMIEVPSAVSLSGLLAKHADFLSIGTNDLIQYTLAVDRNNERVANFFEPHHPAILHAISQVAKAGKKANKQVGVCGEVAVDPALALLFIGLGINQLSLIPSGIPLLKKAILEVNLKDLEDIARKALRATTIEEVKNCIQDLKRFAEDEENFSSPLSASIE